MSIDKELKIRDREQKKKLDADKARRLRELESADTMLVTVTNHDFVNQGVPIEFMYNGIRKYSIKDGETIELPIPVIDHINSLKVMESKYEIDDATGQGRSRPFMRQRWSALPANSFTDMLRGSAKQASKGEKAHEKAA
jgi:hypothetical protein